VIDSFERVLAGTARLVADAPGINSKRVASESAGMKTGASAIIVLSDSAVVPTDVTTVANCIWPSSLQASLPCKLIATGSPDELLRGCDLETKKRKSEGEVM
jgi:hypothetical protein